MSDFKKLHMGIDETSAWLTARTNEANEIITISFNFKSGVFRKSITPENLYNLNEKVTYKEVWFLINEVEKKLSEDNNVSAEERNRILDQMRGVAKEYKKEEEKLDKDKLK